MAGNQRVSTVAEVADMIRQLTEPYVHAETYRRGPPGDGHRRTRRVRTHRVEHPSLLDQLRMACLPGLVDDAGSRINESKPPIATDALDVLMRIEAGAADWVTRRLGLPMRPTVEGNLRLLPGHVAAHPALADVVTSWWRWARVETNWDGRPRDLRDPCPYCGHHMLRVRWDAQAAWCRKCGADWGAGEVGVLAAMIDAIRAEAAAKAEADPPDVTA